MINRKKKLRIYQALFFIAGIAIIIFTYIAKDKFNQEKIVSKSIQKKLESQLKRQDSDDLSKFYNVKYSGLDLEGNRYTIFSKEAVNNEKDSSIVKMKEVIATFYFKDNTVLKVSSDEGDYNNQTLDIVFKKNVYALYENSKLYAEKAEFSNSKNYLTISNNVKVIDSRGTVFADKLLFDIKKKQLNITSLKNKMIKSEINYK